MVCPGKSKQIVDSYCFVEGITQLNLVVATVSLEFVCTCIHVSVHVYCTLKTQVCKLTSRYCQ